MDYVNRATNIFKEIRKISKENNLKIRISDKEIYQYADGKEGEELVSKELRKSFPNMILLDDIYVDISMLKSSVNGYGPSMQIDHVLISDHAIYIIETKKYYSDAEISGTSYSQNWIYKDKFVKSSSRYNADKQNKFHVDSLRKILKLGDIPIISIVCLINIDSKNIKVSTQYGRYVFLFDELTTMIEAIEKKYHMNHINKNEYRDRITNIIIQSEEVEMTHIIYVRLLKKVIRESKKGKKRKKNKIVVS